MIDGTGAIQAQYRYQPFGTSTKNAGALDSDRQYAAYFAHARSGLYLTNSRFYSSAFGRFVSRDREDPDYIYVDNNPLGYNDPQGEDGLGAAIGAAIGSAIGGGLEGAGGAMAGAPAGPFGSVPLGASGAAQGAAMGGVAGGAVGSIIPAQAIIQQIGRAADQGLSNVRDWVNQMAQHGKNRQENEWSREARKHDDPCKWLEEQYNNANNADRQKIKCAQKNLGCRRNRQSKDNNRCGGGNGGGDGSCPVPPPPSQRR